MGRWNVPSSFLLAFRMRRSLLFLAFAILQLQAAALFAQWKLVSSGDFSTCRGAMRFKGGILWAAQETGEY